MNAASFPIHLSRYEDDAWMTSLRILRLSLFSPSLFIPPPTIADSRFSILQKIFCQSLSQASLARHSFSFVQSGSFILIESFMRWFTSSHPCCSWALTKISSWNELKTFTFSILSFWISAALSVLTDDCSSPSNWISIKNCQTATRIQDEGISESFDNCYTINEENGSWKCDHSNFSYVCLVALTRIVSWQWWFDA